MSWTHPDKGERSYKHIKRFVDSPTGKTKIYLIHGPGNSSEEWKVLGDIGTKYAKSRPTKDHGKIPIPRKSVNRQKEKNAIDNNAVNKIIPTQKISGTNREAPVFLISNYNVNNVCEFEKMSLEETKENID